MGAEIVGSNNWKETPSFKDDIGSHSLITSARTIRLDQMEAVYVGTQHDWKSYDWDGNFVGQGHANPWQPRLAQAQMPGMVPLQARRPCNPYRLGRLVVNAFTSLLFDADFPTFKVLGDEDSTDCVNALVKAQRLPAHMVRARTLGGIMGTVGLSWAYVRGKPRCRVHNAKHLYVHAWDDRDELIPRHVTELYRYCEPRWNPDTKKVEDFWYWHRRDWTTAADIVFKPCPYEEDEEPEWVVDIEKTAIHNHEFCHFIWIQNFPNGEIDGLSDIDGLDENLADLDILNSVMSKALRKNLDPTLILKGEAAFEKMMQQIGGQGGGGLIRKGSDWAMMIPIEGDAKYLEITGAGITVALEKLKADTKHILDTAQCVITDPDQLAAQGLSGVAIRLVFGPMTKRGWVLRSQYGAAMEWMLKQQLLVAQEGYVGHEEMNENGEMVTVKEELDLPPKEEQVEPQPDPPAAPVPDDDRLDEKEDDDNDHDDPFVKKPDDRGPETESEAAPGSGDPPKPFGDDVPPPKHPDELDPEEVAAKPLAAPKPEKKLVEHKPGHGEYIEIDWPDFFPDTPDDISKSITTLSTAVGGIAVVSQQTAVEEAAKALGRDPADEWAKVTSDGKKQKQEDMQAMQKASALGGGPGGQVPPGGMPPGAKPKGAPPFGGGGKPPFGGKPMGAPGAPAKGGPPVKRNFGKQPPGKMPV